MERERYAKRSNQEKQEISRRATENARARRAKEAEIHAALKQTVNVLAGNTERKIRGDTLLPVMPFRLWILTNLRDFGGLAGLAKRAKLKEEILQPYMEGVWWESDCRPHPVEGVRLSFVDSFFTRLGMPDQLIVTYPMMDELDAETYKDG